MEISNQDGLERPVASIREIISINFVELLRKDYAAEKEELAGDAEFRRALNLWQGTPRFEGGR